MKTRVFRRVLIFLMVWCADSRSFMGRTRHISLPLPCNVAGTPSHPPFLAPWKPEPTPLYTRVIEMGIRESHWDCVNAWGKRRQKRWGSHYSVRRTAHPGKGEAEKAPKGEGLKGRELQEVRAEWVQTDIQWAAPEIKGLGSRAS